MNGRADRAMPSLAEILNVLFERHTKPNGKPHSNEDLASWARDRGVEMSQAHVWNLRNPDRHSDPRASHVKIIARFFGYQPGYLIDPQVYWEVEGELSGAAKDVTSVAALQGGELSRVMLRKVDGMSPQSAALIQELINQVFELERGHVRDEREHS